MGIRPRWQTNYLQHTAKGKGLACGLPVLWPACLALPSIASDSTSHVLSPQRKKGGREGHTQWKHSFLKHIPGYSPYTIRNKSKWNRVAKHREPNGNGCGKKSGTDLPPSPQKFCCEISTVDQHEAFKSTQQNDSTKCNLFVRKRSGNSVRNEVPFHLSSEWHPIAH